jgi:hypothetical protein
MKRRRINEQAPKLFAFGSTTKQTNAKKSIKVFLQRAGDAELEVVANALRRITLKAINLNKVNNQFDIAQFKAAVDLLKPEMLETLFGELKQAYPQKIDYNPYVMEPEDMAAMAQQSPQQAQPTQPEPAPEPAPQTAPQVSQEPEEEEEPAQPIQERKNRKIQRVKRLVEALVRKNLKKYL